MNEISRILNSYERRNTIPKSRYDPLSPASFMQQQEKERLIIRLINKFNLIPLENKTLLEIGCGNASELLKFLQLGFSPKNLIGNELITDRANIAKQKVPSELKIIQSNALDLEFNENTFDIIYQSMVFSSILDEDFKKSLAKKIWGLLKKNGGILWYDFTFNNPMNKDVKGISKKDIIKLFPESKITSYRLTLAPPLARQVTKLNHRLYSLFNSTYFLRTHLLCWIQKP